MPILSLTGRSSWQHRLLVGVIYAALFAGGLTMVYPLLLMISGSTKSGVDQNESSVLPSYLRSDRALLAKHTEGLFNETLDMLKSVYDVDIHSFADVTSPGESSPKLVREWELFLQQSNLPHYYFGAGYMTVSLSRNVQPFSLRSFKQQLSDRFDGDLSKVNSALQREFTDWSRVTVKVEDYRVRRGVPSNAPYDLTFAEFKTQTPLADRYYPVLELFYRNGFLKNQYAGSLAAYNAAHQTTYSAWNQIRLAKEYLKNPSQSASEWTEWEIFVREVLSPLWIGVDGSATEGYHRYLLARYGDVQALNARYQTSYRSADEAPLPGIPLPSGTVLADWVGFIQGWQDPETKVIHKAPIESIRLRGVDYQFRDFLREKYGKIESLNSALDSEFADFDQILPPQWQWHYEKFLQSRTSLRWELTSRNFRTAIDYLLLRGRGVLNTVVYCALAVLAALIVNPLAAFALSRYKPRGTYKVLLFLMLTMAFPPMVTQIPAFLMIRNFGMLNTFWALILPGLANGYSIFLLKGFFDSLPHELYESATIDGAGEFRIFWQITMSLSKPILAVIALNAFTLAYSNFMFALLICQDQRMWTITVWLYQLQTQSGPGLIYASLLLAAIPTFVIFVFCQNIIMRGIVVPVEK